MNEDELRGQLIARLREDQLWTREELARRARVTPTTVSQAEAGQTRVRLRTIGKLADALGVPAAILLRPTEEKELAGAGKADAPEDEGPTWMHKPLDLKQYADDEGELVKLKVDLDAERKRLRPTDSSKESILNSTPEEARRLNLYWAVLENSLRVRDALDRIHSKQLSARDSDS